MAKLIGSQAPAERAEDLRGRADVYRERADLVSGRLARLALLQLARDCDEAAARLRPSGHRAEVHPAICATTDSNGEA